MTRTDSSCVVGMIRPPSTPNTALFIKRLIIETTMHDENVKISDLLGRGWTPIEPPVYTRNNFFKSHQDDLEPNLETLNNEERKETNPMAGMPNDELSPGETIPSGLPEV